MNLIVDVGNTLVKMAVFDNGKIISYRKIPNADFTKSVKAIVAEYVLIQNAIVSNVGIPFILMLILMCVALTFCKVWPKGYAFLTGGRT